MRQAGGIFLAVAGLWTGVAAAAGFEKSVPFSGRFAGMGGATSAVVDGAQSLAFNPAGLARAPMGQREGGPFELSLQFSPTWSTFSGPIAGLSTEQSATGFSPIFGGFVGWRPTGKVGVGVGGFYTAGVNAKYEGVSLAALNPNFDSLTPDFKAYLRVVDLSAGLGIEVVKGLRVGAAYRISMVGAELRSASAVPGPTGSPAGTPPGALVSANLTDLTDTSYAGFRVGAQYVSPSDYFSLGVHWRSPITFVTQGDVAGAVESGVAAGPSAPLSGGRATVTADLPWQLVVGASVSPIPHKLLLVGEYVFTAYDTNQALKIGGSLQGPQGPIVVPDLPLGWDNMHNVRAGFEWGVIDALQVRAGYVFTTRVTPPERARATLAIPGSAHTLTVGVGGAIASHLRLDAAFESSFGDAEGTSEFGVAGTFKERAWVAHLGAGIVL